MENKKIYKMSISAILCAIGILIPMVSPFKIIIEPASFTLASHVAIFIAMFVSSGVATAVAFITAIGFLLGGFPITIVLRALSHVIFAFLGARYLEKHNTTLTSVMKLTIFMVIVSIIHAVSEVAFVLPFYINSSSFSEFAYTLFGLVGVGTFLHSCIDFMLSIMIFRVLLKNNSIKKMCSIKEAL